MSATSRELVLQALSMDGPMRAPRSLRVLPLAAETYARELDDIERDYPSDMVTVVGHERERPPTSDGPCATGGYVDAWGCVLDSSFQCWDPLVKDWKSDRGKVHIPNEWLTLNVDAVNRDCASTDKFTISDAYASPFEQLRLIRGSCDFLSDLLDPTAEMLAFMQEMHAFYVELLTCWSRTDVDCLYVVDDWGSERSLLASPSVWREHLKPMYHDYVQIAHGRGKKILFHSDGNILEIFSDLVEMGVDAVNSQIFCLGLRHIKQYAGKITFWGDMDQRLLEGDPSAVDQAVKDVYTSLWANGGCVAQCEFGPGAKPRNLRRMFTSWNTVTG